MLNQKTLTPEKYGLKVVWIFINQIFFLSTEKDAILFKNQISICVCTSIFQHKNFCFKNKQLLKETSFKLFNDSMLNCHPSF